MSTSYLRIPTIPADLYAGTWGGTPSLPGDPDLSAMALPASPTGEGGPTGMPLGEFSAPPAEGGATASATLRGCPAALTMRCTTGEPFRAAELGDSAGAVGIEVVLAEGDDDEGPPRPEEEAGRLRPGEAEP